METFEIFVVFGVILGHSGVILFMPNKVQKRLYNYLWDEAKLMWVEFFGDTLQFEYKFETWRIEQQTRLIQVFSFPIWNMGGNQ